MRLSALMVCMIIQRQLFAMDCDPAAQIKQAIIHFNDACKSRDIQGATQLLEAISLLIDAGGAQCQLPINTKEYVCYKKTTTELFLRKAARHGFLIPQTRTGS